MSAANSLTDGKYTLVNLQQNKMYQLDTKPPPGPYMREKSLYVTYISDSAYGKGCTPRVIIC